jgi:hypothetical protein
MTRQLTAGILMAAEATKAAAEATKSGADAVAAGAAAMAKGLEQMSKAAANTEVIPFEDVNTRNETAELTVVVGKRFIVTAQGDRGTGIDNALWLSRWTSAS